MMRAFGVACCSLAVAVACSQGETPEERTVAVSEPLSNHEHCDTAAATPPGINGSGLVISPSSYGTSQCAKAFLVDVTNPNGFGFVSWQDSTPFGSQAACEGASVWAYLWDTTGGVVNYVGAWRQNGVWVPSANSCSAPSLLLQAPQGSSLQASHKYRFAVSARQDNEVRRVGLEIRSAVPGTGGTHP